MSGISNTQLNNSEPAVTQQPLAGDEAIVFELEHSAQLTKAKIAHMVIHLHSIGWTERAYQACVKSPSIQELGDAADGDVYTGIAFVVQKCIAEGHGEMIQLAYAAPTQHIQNKILQPCIPSLLEKNYSFTAFLTTCNLSDIRKRDVAFLEIIQYLTQRGESDSDLVTDCLEKILNQEIKTRGLFLIGQGLLKEGKEAQAFALISPLDMSDSDNVHLASNLVRWLIENHKERGYETEIQGIIVRLANAKQWKCIQSIMQSIKNSQKIELCPSVS